MLKERYDGEWNNLFTSIMSVILFFGAMVLIIVMLLLVFMFTIAVEQM